MKSFRMVMIAVLVLPLSGCFIKGVIKSELAAYDEPQQGDVAHIRLIGSRNVKVYPNSDCVGGSVTGGGYPAGPQMGGQRKRDLGMPKPADMPRHYVEIAALADQRIAAKFSFYMESQTAVAGRPGTVDRNSASCSVARSFIPEAGQSYEVRTDWDREGCAVMVFRLVADGAGSVRRLPVPSANAPACPTAASQ